VPTLTSNLPGTAPGEDRGRAVQQEPGQAEQTIASNGSSWREATPPKLSKTNEEVAGGTHDPAPPYNNNTRRAEPMPHVPQKLSQSLTRDQDEQLEEKLPGPNPQVAGGTHDSVNTDWPDVSPKIPKPNTQVAGGTSDPATPKNIPAHTFFKNQAENPEANQPDHNPQVSGGRSDPATPNKP
jgi:hypothetical protein